MGGTAGGTNVQHVDVSRRRFEIRGRHLWRRRPPARRLSAGFLRRLRLRVDDLKPAMALYAGAYPQTVAVNPATGRFYTQNADHPLIVFSATGELENAYRWMNVGETHRLVVHPQGKKLLAISERRIVWVELPDDLSRGDVAWPKSQ